MLFQNPFFFADEIGSIGSVIFAPTIQRVTEMISSPHWQHRHAALSSIASIAEGCPDETRENMRYLLGLVLQGFKDDHPRVKYAAIYAIGQLCTDGEGALQEEHGREVLQALVLVCGAREARFVPFFGINSWLNQILDFKLTPLLVWSTSLQLVLQIVFKICCQVYSVL